MKALAANFPGRAPPDAARRTLLRWSTLAGIGAAAGVLPGCSLLVPPRTIPLRTLRPDRGPCDAAAATTLLVLLPGAYSRPEAFVDEGFVSAVRQRRLAVDIVIADAHMGYVEDRSLLLRLREDVVLPARRQGYRAVWLVGISLGGFTALGYAARHGEEIDGVLALAPWPGGDALVDEIARAGGPAAWRLAPHAREADDDLPREIWEKTGVTPPVYLGYGIDDRFAAANRSFASLLPAGRSREVPGDHDWPAWLHLWNDWLDRGLLPGACSAAGR